MRVIRALGDWFDHRVGARATLGPLLTHPVPRTTASWWYVFGSATLALFALQLVTGICLALVYVPTADEAYQTLEYLNYQTPFGWFLRATHFWGSNGMVLVMTLHLIQVFLWGAYKYPRELTWVVGVFLFLCTLGMAFSGQVLRWDKDAYWGLGIGAAMAGRAPVIGRQLVEVLLGGPIIAGRTLSRFFALHVFVLIRQVLQGGSMPAYGKYLTPAEVTAVVAFMQILRPAREPPARSAVIPAMPGR